MSTSVFVQYEIETQEKTTSQIDKLQAPVLAAPSVRAAHDDRFVKHQLKV